MGPRVKSAPKAFPQTALPTLRVGEVEPMADPAGHWLVEGLWSARAAGVLGGPPKSAKTWCAVDLALSVASGTDALGHFAVKDPGTVLFFGAEDAPALLRERFGALAAHRGLSLQSLDVLLLDVPVLKLDSEKDRKRLSDTVRAVRPRLLVLDPLVRMHSLDENSATEISGLLAFLRQLEREHDVAILLVHHTRKNAASGLQSGVGLRGSSDIHAFGDSNIYIRRRGEDFLLSVEHRSAPSPPPITLALRAEPTPHLVVVEAEAEPPDLHEPPAAQAFPQEILWHLQSAGAPLRVDDLRTILRVRKQRVIDALRVLARQGLVRRSGDGFVALGEAAED